MLTTIPPCINRSSSKATTPPHTHPRHLPFPGARVGSVHPTLPASRRAETGSWPRAPSAHPTATRRPSCPPPNSRPAPAPRARQTPGPRRAGSRKTRAPNCALRPSPSCAARAGAPRSRPFRRRAGSCPRLSAPPRLCATRVVTPAGLVGRWVRF